MESSSFEKIEFGEEANELRKRIKPLMYKDVTRDKIVAFARELQEKHSTEELHNYEAYCALVGSTPMKQPEHFDLLDDESIVQYIERLENEIEEPEEK